jgi:hypothetical protein
MPKLVRNPKNWLAIVKKQGMKLRHVPVSEQTPEICLAAVQNDEDALEHVQNQTPEICMAAVQNDGHALVYVKEQTPEICLAAVQGNAWALQFVEEQTPEICLAAVRQNGYALMSVKEQTHEICLAAIQQDPNALQYVRIDILNPTSFEELPNSVDMEGIIDPVTFEEPTPGTICAFYVRDGQWFFLATLDSCRALIKSRVLNCNPAQITDPQRKIIVPVSEIRWVRLGGF